MKKIILLLLLLCYSAPALAQNPQCPTRPVGNNTNACASTAFVQNAASAANILSYGAIANDNTKGVVNAAAFAAAFAASPSVYCPDGQTFYSQDVVIPATGTHLFGKCTIIAAGTMSIASIVSQNNSAGLLIEDVKVQVNTGTYPTIYGILLNGNLGTTILGVSTSGLHGILISTSTFASILNNKASSFSGIGIYSNTGGADLLISGNTTSGGANGVVLTSSARANVSNNTISGTSSIAISAAASSSYVNIAGNQVVNAGGGAGISFNICTHCQAVNNNVTGSAAFGITASLGGDILIAGNSTYATVREGVHVDSLDSTVISSNNLVFTVTSADVGISVSNDNTTLATNVQVVGNNVVSPFGACIYFVGVQYSTAIANKCRNANVGPSIINSSIVLDGSMTQHNTIGTNTIEDTIGNNLYQVAEGNFTAGGTPSNNIIAQQLGSAGTTGFILASTTTNRIARATSSSNNPDTISGFYFDASPFAQRSIPSTSVVLYDYSGLAVGSLGSTGTPTIFWADTTHEWWDRGVGTKFASLDTNSWSWRAVAAAATPASGIGRVYIDSTTKALTNKDDAGTLHTTVIANAGGSNLFVSAVSAAGVISTAQPSVSNISGFGTGVATWLGAPSAANFSSAITGVLSTTKTVRAAGGAADCSLIFTGGLLTGGSC